MNDGGAAFPLAYHAEGMSLRDWFAGQALAGIIATASAKEVNLPTDEEASQWSYAYADAMLAERQKQLDPKPARE